MRKIKNCIVVGRLLFGCSTNVLFFFVNIIVTDYLFCEKKATITTVTYSFARRQSDHFCDMQHWFGGLLHLFQTLNSIWLLPYGILIIIFTCVCFYFFPFFFFYLLLYDSKKKDHKTNQNKPNGKCCNIYTLEVCRMFYRWKRSKYWLFFVQSCVLLNVASVNCKWRRTNTVWCRFVCTKNTHIFTSFIWTIKIKRNNEPSFVWLYWAIGIVDREIVKLARIPIAQSDRETEALEIESTKCAANGILNSKNATFAFFSLAPFRSFSISLSSLTRHCLSFSGRHQYPPPWCISIAYIFLNVNSTLNDCIFL